MLETILYCAAAFGFWNGIRGRGFFKQAAKRGEYPAKILVQFFRREACCLYLGLTLWAVIEAKFSGNGALGFYAAIILGWGKYFMAFHGNNVLHEKENPWVDPVVDWVMGYEPGKAYTPAYCRKYGVWGMTLVGFQFVPLFIWPLCSVSAPMWVYFVPLVSLSMGLVYGAMRYLRDKTSTLPAEIVFATIIGAAYGLIISYT